MCRRSQNEILISKLEQLCATSVQDIFFASVGEQQDFCRLLGHHLAELVQDIAKAKAAEALAASQSQSKQKTRRAVQSQPKATLQASQPTLNSLSDSMTQSQDAVAPSQRLSMLQQARLHAQQAQRTQDSQPGAQPERTKTAPPPDICGVDGMLDRSEGCHGPDSAPAAAAAGTLAASPSGQQEQDWLALASFTSQLPAYRA